MGYQDDAPAPGGWFRQTKVRIASTLVVGLLAGGGGIATIYGQFQGAQAEHYIEAQLESATANTVTYSALNPLPEDMSGAIVYSPENYVFLSEQASPTTRLNVCTASGASQPCTKVSGISNVMSGVYLNGSNRILSTSATGGQLTATTAAILAPRNYDSPAMNRLNFTFTVGSGQTVSGNAPAFARFKVVPCNLDGVGC